MDNEIQRHWDLAKKTQNKNKAKMVFPMGKRGLWRFSFLCVLWSYFRLGI